MQRLFFLAFVALSIFCACDRADLQVAGIDLDQDYIILLDKHRTSGKKDAIVFNTDGTYRRTEFTGHRRHSEDGYYTMYGFYIDELMGRWQWKDGTLHLFDQEIIKCRCLKYNDVVQEENDCLPSRDEIGFGSSEWFEGFVAVPGNDHTLFIQRK